MDYNEKQAAILVSGPGIIREATTAMLDSIPQIGQVQIASGPLSAMDPLRNGNSSLLVIDANVPVEEAASLVRWSKQRRPDIRCIVLVRSVAELEQARAAGADAVFLRSSSARQLAETLWPKDQEQ